jgi:AraC-like DNA-binding protein
MDRHYLLCVSSGTIRLEAHGTVWMLPPQRAALVTAGEPIQVTVPVPVTSSSVLVSPTFAPAPAAPLSVFDLSPLARLLLDECAAWGDSDEPLSDRAVVMFRPLVEATWELARTQSPARMPSGRSPELRRALALTEAAMADHPTFEAIAREVGLTSRSLARRFEDEIGMTWRAALRRLRVLRSIELLATDPASVTDVAVRVGYASLPAFNAAFRDLTGTTPSAYRSTFRR